MVILFFLGNRCFYLYLYSSEVKKKKGIDDIETGVKKREKAEL